MSSNKNWYSRVALFGESSFALFCSSSLLAFSFVIALYLDADRDLSPTERAYRNLEQLPTIAPPKIFQVDDRLDDFISDEMRRAFHRDGVIAIRGLLDPTLLRSLDDATMEIVEEQQKRNDLKKKPKVLTGRKKPPKQFFTVNQGTIFQPVKENSTSPFIEVALRSKIPQVVANLLEFDGDPRLNRTLRVLRDIFLVKDEEEYICGWHVDDVGFWPSLAEGPGDPVGINAWLALDDMPISDGGGFALAVGSHNTSWKEVAYASIGSTHFYPSNGFDSARDILQNRPGNGTCNIQYTAPHIHRRMEETKRIYDVKAGDVIFHTRWLFHRTVPFDRDKVFHRERNNENPLLYRRYSIRYGPGTSIIPPGYGTEPSVISEKMNGGRSADHVSKYDSAWYPQAWPSVSNIELEQMKILAEGRLPRALEVSEQRKKVIRPRLKKRDS